MTSGRARPLTIGVVMPNRNDAGYLERAVGSVLAQVPPPDEFIVVDDQSTDDSVARIRRMIDGRAYARLIENPVNLGTIGTINLALREARSDYLLFLASNDFVLPGLIARARSLLERCPAVGFWSAMTWLVDTEDRVIRLHASPVISPTDRAFAPDECLRLIHRVGSWLGGPTIVYRRDALIDIGGFDAGLGGLCDLMAAMALAVRHGAAFAPVPLAGLRLHPGSVLTKTLTGSAGLDDLLDRVRDYLGRHAPALAAPRYFNRIERRIRFAAARATEPTAPAPLRALRTARLFMRWRAFDIVPAAIYRLLGPALVRARHRQSPS